MQAQRSHRFIDQLLNACVLTIGLYIATVPVASSTSKETQRSIDSAKQLQSMSPPMQKQSGQLAQPSTYQVAANRTCIQEFLHVLNTFIFHQTS
jgi:hypothetical protein